MNAPTITTKRSRVQRPENPLPPGLQDESRELIPLPDPSDLDDTDPEETPEDRVMTMLRGSANDARAQVRIYRAGKNGSEYCGVYTAAEFEERNLDLIREDFGAGEYSVMLYGTLPGSQRFGIRTRQTIRIAESRVPAAPYAMPANNDTAAMLKVITDGQRQLTETLVAMQTNRPDPMAQMGTMLTLMTQMREAMGMSGSGATHQKSSIAEIVDAIHDLRGVAKELDGGGKQTDSTQELIDLAKPIVGMVGEAMRRNPAALPAPQNSALPALQVPASMRTQTNPTQPLETETDPEMLAVLKLKLLLTAVVTMAEKGTDPQAGADLLFEKLPDDLIDVLDTPVWWEMLSAKAPEVIPHQEWLTKARDLLLAMFDDEPAPEASGTPVAPAS